MEIGIKVRASDISASMNPLESPPCFKEIYSYPLSLTNRYLPEEHEPKCPYRVYTCIIWHSKKVHFSYYQPLRVLECSLCFSFTRAFLIDCHSEILNIRYSQRGDGLGKENSPEDREKGQRTEGRSKRKKGHDQHETRVSEDDGYAGDRSSNGDVETTRGVGSSYETTLFWRFLI